MREILVAASMSILSNKLISYINNNSYLFLHSFLLFSFPFWLSSYKRNHTQSTTFIHLHPSTNTPNTSPSSLTHNCLAFHTLQCVERRQYSPCLLYKKKAPTTILQASVVCLNKYFVVHYSNNHRWVYLFSNCPVNVLISFVLVIIIAIIIFFYC